MADKEILSSVYDFLLQHGHKTAAKALLKDASTDEAKLKAIKHEKLEELFTK
jgi:hypothetical protein